MFVILVVNLYTSRVILRTLGVTDYGIFNVVAGFVTLFSFLNTSMSNGIQRFFSYEIGLQRQNGIKEVYITSITIQSILGLIIFICLETFGVWYLNNIMDIPPDRLYAAQYIFQFSLLSLLVVLMQVPYVAAIMAYEKMNFYAVVGMIDITLKLIIVLILPLFKLDSLVLYGFLLLAVSVIDFLLYYIYSKKKFYGLSLSRKFYKNRFHEMISFSGWNVLGTFAFMMKGQGLNLLLNAFFGPIVNAARGIANQVMTAMQSFSSNIVIAFRPQLVQSYAAKDYQRVKYLFFEESKITYILVLAMITPVLIEIDFILDIWIGKDFTPAYTIPFTFLVLINMLVSTFHTPMVQVVHASGKMKWFQIIISIIICSIIPISWLFLKNGYGPNSVFIVSLILSTINIIASLIIVHRIFAFNYTEYLREVIAPCLVLSFLTPLLPFLISFLMPSSVLRIVLVCIADIISILFLTYHIALSNSEKQIAKSIIKKITSKIRK